MAKICLLVAAFCLLLAACGSDQTNTNTSSQQTAQANYFVTPTFNPPTPQNPNVTLIPFNLPEKLEAQGLTVTPNGLETTFSPVTQVYGNILMVNQERLTYYEFPDSAAAQAIIISPEGATFQNRNGAGVSVSLVKIGLHVYRKDNLIVWYAGVDPTIINALIAVMGSQVAGD